MTLSTRQSPLFPQPWKGYPESIVNRGMWLRGAQEKLRGRAAVRRIKLLNSLTVGLQRLTKSLTCASHGKDEKRTQNFSTKNLKGRTTKHRWKDNGLEQIIQCKKSCPITGLNRPTGFQDVKAPRFLDIGT
jgi:hypothetical protein